MKVAIPTVHLNGTAGTVLQALNETALCAVEHAIEQLTAAGPHGRDYYVQGDIDRPFAVAAAQHGARLRVLLDTRNELREIVRGIRRQNEARAVRA